MSAGGAGPGLLDRYDLLLFDLDGVLYVGDRAVPGAPEVLPDLRQRGVPVRYVTNNASRGAAAVAGLLSDLGIPASPEQVVTSAQAAARLLAERLPTGEPVLVVGADALAHEIDSVGLRALPAGEQVLPGYGSGAAAPTGSESPRAVVQGYGPDVGWRELAQATVAIQRGALWIATNADRTLPSPYGALPGNGALVAAVSVATGRDPDVVVGKPAPELFQTAVRGAGARRPLVIGDRLDTDIEGAVRAGYPSVLVLTGVAKPADAWRAPEGQRPTYLAADLAGLAEPYPVRIAGNAAAECGGWTARHEGESWSLDGSGTPLDALRALCAARWSGPAGTTEQIVGRTPAASSALTELGLPLAG
ncbi:MAG: HAD-IIA family hydrolase [Micromonosporaceae bacterium]